MREVQNLATIYFPPGANILRDIMYLDDRGDRLFRRHKRPDPWYALENVVLREFPERAIDGHS